ncbi:hypothetical protein MBLNU457_6183t1 [Dothideomycetes sp. NU457]
MDVSLYVYDLSKGMARAMSKQFLGIQIDAVYHTAIVLNGVEYFFGAGVQTCYPGSTHHGRPMEVVPLGQTQLPIEVILEYLESLKQIYTPESYDLFAHNCNNFSNDFSMFLVGKGIPEHITSLPETVLQTPFGQMMKPQLDAQMRSVTQAPVPAQKVPHQAAPVPKAAGVQQPMSNGGAKAAAHGEVYNVTQMSVLDKHLAEAQKTCAVIFFTSSTCAPCKIAYPAFDSLAAENPKATFVKVDINQAQDIAMRYQIRATPTFMTFLHGKKENEWAGANPSQLLGNVRLLIQQAIPAHPHAALSVPAIQNGSLRPVSFTKIPPLDKVIAKMGPSANDPAVEMIKTFLMTRQSQGAREAPLPNLAVFAKFLQSAPQTLTPETLFSAYDLLRCAVLDPRVAGWFAEESGPSQPTTLHHLLQHTKTLIDNSSCPYNLRLVTVQLATNLFSSPLTLNLILSNTTDLASLIINLATTSLLAEPDKPALRAAATSLALNVAGANYRVRREEEREALDQGLQVELAASLLEYLGSVAEGESEGDDEAVRAALMALGYLVHYAPEDGEVWDLCRALSARATVAGVQGKGDGVKKIVKDVAAVMPKGDD